MKCIVKISVIWLMSINVVAAQSKGVHIYEFKDRQLVQMMTSIDTTIAKTDGNINVILFRIENPFGSAHLSGTDEISIKYAAAVGYSDDTPNYKLFNLGDYINPTVLAFEMLRNGNFRVTIQYGLYKYRKQANYLINLKGVTLVKD